MATNEHSDQVINALTTNAKAEVNAEVDTALNTQVPASPTAGSLNDILSKAAGGNTFNKATDSLEALADSLGSGTYGLSALKTLIDVLTAYVDTEVAAIKAVTDAEETLTETGGTVTTDGTEQNVYIADAPSGLFTPTCLKLDCTNHTAGETIVVRTYYRIKTGGNYILQTATTHAAAIVPALLNIELEPNRFGVKVTIEKTGGDNRAYDWEAVYGA